MRSHAIKVILIVSGCGGDPEALPRSAGPSANSALGQGTSTVRTAELSAACARIECRTTSGKLARGRSKPSEFSTDGVRIYEFGRPTDFDPPSFRFWPAADCALWGDSYAADSRDVYARSPQSCGGDNCGGDYTGFYWEPLGVRDPESFAMLPGGYGRDKGFVYYRWGQSQTVDGADAGTFEVLWCGDSSQDRDGKVIGRDSGRYYVDGKAVPPEAVTARWHK
jgi:hypothetical protein